MLYRPADVDTALTGTYFGRVDANKERTSQRSSRHSPEPSGKKRAYFGGSRREHGCPRGSHQRGVPVRSPQSSRRANGETDPPAGARRADKEESFMPRFITF